MKICSVDAFTFYLAAFLWKKLLSCPYEKPFVNKKHCSSMVSILGGKFSGEKNNSNCV